MNMPAVPKHQCDRFFFAVQPDADAARGIHLFTVRELPEGRPVPLTHQHVTLALTEDAEPPADALAERLREVGAQVRGDPFDLVFDRLSASCRSVALVPDNTPAALFALQRSIADAMARGSVPMRLGWRFRPHQTLCHRKGEPFSRAVQEFRYAVREFLLIRSVVGMTRHEVVDRWPLKADSGIMDAA